MLTIYIFLNQFFPGSDSHPIFNIDTGQGMNDWSVCFEKIILLPVEMKKD
jgi:hypothetical protein